MVSTILLESLAPKQGNPAKLSFLSHTATAIPKRERKYKGKVDKQERIRIIRQPKEQKKTTFPTV